MLSSFELEKSFITPGPVLNRTYLLVPMCHFIKKSTLAGWGSPYLKLQCNFYIVLCMLSIAVLL